MKKQNTEKTKEGGWIITAAVYTRICDTIGRRKPEWGGILGSSDGIHIDHYYFDINAERCSGSYTMNTTDLNRVIHEWNDNQIRLIGVIHSHPNGVIRPSLGDMETARHIINTMDVEGRFFTPIVQVSSKLDGAIKIYPYSFEETVTCVDQALEIDRTTPEEAERQKRLALAETAPNRFQRIRSVFPDNVMEKKTVICVGCGGSRAFLETLARCGVGKFILIDGDTVEDTNIATQGTFVSEIGKSKVEVIRDRLYDINPLVHVVCVNRYLDNDITDKDFEQLLMLKNAERSDMLICGCTDNFYAQDRCAQLSVKFSIPYLAAQIFPEGVGHEVIFWYPGLTKACPRCMLESRYRKLLTGTQSAEGSSAGAAVCITDYLNAIKAYIAISALCYNEAQTPYYKQLDKLADRNYLMTRCSDKLSAPAFEPITAMERQEPDLSFLFGTLAIGQTQEKDCPLCKGKDVNSRRIIRDTRVITNPYDIQGGNINV